MRYLLILAWLFAYVMAAPVKKDTGALVERQVLEIDMLNEDM
jgi:hypothetical protein